MPFMTRAQLAMLTSSFLWGVAPIFVGVALDSCTPLFIMTMRFGIAVLVMSVFIPKIQHRNGLLYLKTPTIMVIGFLISMGYLSSTIGQNLTTAGLATLLSTSYVMMVPFMTWKLKHSNLSKEIIFLAFLALVGMFFISYNGDWNNFSNITSIGTLYLLVAAVSWGLNIVLTDKFMTDMRLQTGTFDYLSFLYASLIYTFLPLFVLSFFLAPPPTDIILNVLPIFLFLGIFGSIITFGLYQYALSKMGAVNTAFYLLLQILVPFSYEIVFLRITYSAWILIGSAFVLLTMVTLESHGLQHLHNLFLRYIQRKPQNHC
ncbi:MAG: DMT family transporter [Candidatus Heimdallarchaeota archaeon]|nr:DMT family transporter [Candidatus Heimdallarchaeota archaeon]